MYRSSVGNVAGVVHLSDAEGDVVDVRVSFLTDDSDMPVPLDAAGTTELSLAGSAADDGMGGVNLIGPVGTYTDRGVVQLNLTGMTGVTRARVEAVDASRLRSVPMIVALEVMPIAAEGEICDVEAVAECAAGMVCVHDWFTGATCQVRTPPVLATARVADNRAGQRMGIEVTGIDADGDIQYVRFHLFDGDPEAGGVPVPVPTWGGIDGLVYFDIAVPDGEGFYGRLFMETHAASPDSLGYVAPFTHAQIALEDAAGLVSNWQTVQVEAAPIVGEGEPCDTLVGFNLCGPELVCDPATETCGPRP